MKWPVLILVMLIAASVQAAKPTISILDFTGPQGPRYQRALLKALQRHYRVLPGRSLLEACSTLGLTLQRGDALARCAQKIQAIAVIGASVRGRSLVVAVYSGRSGQPLASRRFALRQRMIRRVLRFVGLALRRAPPLPPPQRITALPPVVQAVPPPLLPPPRVKDAPPVSTTHPHHTDDPEVPTGLSTHRRQRPPKPNKPRKLSPKKRPAKSRSRLLVSARLGTWMRDFKLNDSLGDPVQYSSGAVFAAGAAVRIFPAAFFATNWTTGLFLASDVVVAIGLKSRDETSGSVFSTQQFEWTLDLGYRISFGSPLRPTVDVRFGYGMLNFTIDWAGGTARLPNWNYQFLRLGVGARFPFGSFVGLTIDADYRPVLTSGAIEDEVVWFGPSSTGGLSTAAAIYGQFMSFDLRVGYQYTRFFYAFEDPLGRQAAGRANVAAGAVDQFHTILVSLGYTL